VVVAAGMATAAAGTVAAATADIAQVSLPSPPEESSGGLPSRAWTNHLPSRAWTNRDGGS